MDEGGSEPIDSQGAIFRGRGQDKHHRSKKWNLELLVGLTRMSPKKTPTSSLSGSLASEYPAHRLTVTTTIAAELLVKRVWYRSRARIRGTLSGGASPAAGVTPPSPAMRLPQEIVEMIFNYLFYNSRALRSCSLTCYSWYIAAVPHLHSTLYMIKSLFPRKRDWPNPIWYKHMLGLLPLVKPSTSRGGSPTDSTSGFLQSGSTAVHYVGFDTNQRSNLANTMPGHPQLHAKDSTILPPLLTDAPVSPLEFTDRVESTDYILRWIIPAP